MRGIKLLIDDKAVSPASLDQVVTIEISARMVKKRIEQGLAAAWLMLAPIQYD